MEATYFVAENNQWMVGCEYIGKYCIVELVDGVITKNASQPDSQIHASSMKYETSSGI